VKNELQKENQSLLCFDLPLQVLITGGMPGALDLQGREE
jgi:hypothetical protein